MPREHVDYRANIELLNEMFPGTAMLTEEQAAKAMGFRDKRTVRKIVPFVSHRVSKAALARIMCG